MSTDRSCARLHRRCAVGRSRRRPGRIRAAGDDVTTPGLPYHTLGCASRIGDRLGKPARQGNYDVS